MSPTLNHMDGLLSLQQALNSGLRVNKLDADYIEHLDEIPSGRRYCYAKVVAGEVQALATFGQEESINSVDCYSLNYAVSEKYRRRGLAVEIVNRGLEELKKHLRKSKKSFYVDAIVEMTNTPSIEVAKKTISRKRLAATRFFHKCTIFIFS
ncbi:MAG: GNAT family N-acetyltransferase [Bdellovibrionales bacterium]|nr:GNAT family N-acetyltransferase [Bdellovibrionales bacterium]